MQKDKYTGRVIMIIIVLLVNSRIFAQSSSFGDTYVGSGAELLMVDIEHSFLAGSVSAQPGIIVTERTVPRGYFGFVGTASYTGVSDTAHVDGYVRTYMTTPFTFPIGDNGVYRPASVSTSSDTAPTDAAYYGVNPTTDSYPATSVGSGVVNVSTTEYWDINGTTPATITLTWNNASGVTSLTATKIVGWDGTKWVEIPATVVASSTTTAGSITTNNTIAPNTYSVYSLAGIGVLPEGQITAKVLLQGALNGTTGTMTKALNTQNLIPLSDPYGLGATTTSTVLTTNEITDWVRVELRTGTSGATIQESIAALVSIDGTLHNPDGSTPLKFQATTGNFYVAIRHRNHLGVMTASTVALSSIIPVVDFTSSATSTFGSNAQAIIGSIKALWAGNATGLTVGGTDNVRYSTGDVNAITGYLTTQTGSVGGVITGVYTKEDTNLDGIVRYSGGTRDILPITTTILSHPVNQTQTFGFVVTQSF